MKQGFKEKKAFNEELIRLTVLLAGKDKVKLAVAEKRDYS